MHTLRIRIQLTAMVVAALLAAGCATDTRYSQAQLDAIQMRQLDVPADRAYAGVIGALLAGLGLGFAVGLDARAPGALVGAIGVVLLARTGRGRWQVDGALVGAVRAGCG